MDIETLQMAVERIICALVSLCLVTILLLFIVAIYELIEGNNHG